MISKTLKTAGLVLGVVLLASPALATSMHVITFDDMVHGEVLDANRYEGVTISAMNYPDGHMIAAAFDTTATETRDRDLEDPWKSGNLAGPTNLGSALIIQENTIGCDDGICDFPDDEGSRPGGFFMMQFADPIKAFSLDLIDVDDASAEIGLLHFAKDGVAVGTVGWDEIEGTFVPGAGTVGYGDNSANRLPLFLAQNFQVDSFDTVYAMLGGSGAIDNITWSHTQPVPEPSAALVFAMGLGIAGIRRRR